LPFVLDASVTACWCFYDEHDPRAAAAFDMLDSDHALAPLHWWFEVRNVLLLGERRQRISASHAIGFLDRLQRSPIELAALPDQVGVLALARRHRLSFYDAAYLELAQRRRIALATLDHRLAVAAQTEGVALVGSAS
jgi:predicted nucleic acid-binding protein